MPYLFDLVNVMATGEIAEQVSQETRTEDLNGENTEAVKLGVLDAEDAVILKGSLSLEYVPCEVTLTSFNFHWELKGPVPKKMTIPPKGCIQLCNMIGVACSQFKQGQPGTSTGFCVHYAIPDKGDECLDVKLNVHKVNFECGEESVAKQWSEEIKKRLDDPVFKRPKRLLVFINPISGRSRAPEVYRKHVEPWFALAGIYTQVEITSKQKYPQEFLETFDLNTVDGIVTVGGDGTLQETISALANTTARNAGIDLNSAGVEMKQLPLRVGMISAGTGNAMGPILTGSKDPQSAALHIILGFESPADLMTIHDFDGKFQGFSALLIGYGWFSDIIYTSENRRSLGKWRYLYGFARHLIGFKRKVTMKAQLRYDDQSSSKSLDSLRTTEPSADSEKEDVSADGWVTFTGDFVCLMLFLIGSKDTTACGFIPHCLFCHSIGLISLGRLMLRMLQRNDNMAGLDFLVNKPGVVEGKIEVLPKPDNQGSDAASSASADPSPVDPRDLILDVDGEVLQLEKPQFHFKVHKHVIRGFGRYQGKHQATSTEVPGQEKQK